MKFTPCLLILVLGLMTAYAQMIEHNTPASTRTLRRLRNGRMFERCFGKDRFTATKAKIDPLLKTCLQADPKPYIVKHFSKNDVPTSGNDEANYLRITNEIGNYTCLLEALNFIDKTLNLNVDIVDNYMANLTDDKSTGEILKQDSEDCNAMAKGTPMRLITRSLSPYKYINEMMVRLGIFFHCLRGRLLMTCTEKDYAASMKPHPPLYALSLAKVPLLNKDEYAFVDLFGLLEGSSVWYSFSSI